MAKPRTDNALPAHGVDEVDLNQLLSLADRSDRWLLRLIGCATLATLLLAMAIRLAQ